MLLFHVIYTIFISGPAHLFLLPCIFSFSGPLPPHPVRLLRLPSSMSLISSKETTAEETEESSSGEEGANSYL
jgi:hypothetical protein